MDYKHDDRNPAKHNTRNAQRIRKRNRNVPSIQIRNRPPRKNSVSKGQDQRIFREETIKLGIAAFTIALITVMVIGLVYYHQYGEDKKACDLILEEHACKNETKVTDIKDTLPLVTPKQI